MAEFKNEVSPAAAKRIVELIKFKLWEHGFTDKTDKNTIVVRNVIIDVAAAVKRIVLEDVYKYGKYSDPIASDTQ